MDNVNLVEPKVDEPKSPQIARKQHECGTCGQTGHNVKTCPQVWKQHPRSKRSAPTTPAIFAEDTKSNQTKSVLLLN